VRFRVADLERAVTFYRDVLGLQITQDTKKKLSLAPASTGDELIVLEERQGIAPRPRRPRTAGLYHVALLVPSRRDLGRTLLALGESGYPLRGMSDHAVSESIYLDDPDGNGLEIYADRPRELWPRRNGVVQMTVDPMDVDGVLAAGQADAEPWSGLPSGTVIGHVHFTVSSMERAAAYYINVIGFDRMMQIPSLTAVSAGGYHHHLNLNTWAGEGAASDSEQVAGLIAWELRVPGDHARRELIQRVVSASALAAPSEPASARDPDGNLMEIPNLSA